MILTRDGNLDINGEEREMVERYHHRVFWLGPKRGTGEQWSDSFEEHPAPNRADVAPPPSLRRQGGTGKVRAGLAVTPDPWLVT